MFREADKNFDSVLSFNEITRYSLELLRRGSECAAILAGQCSGENAVTEAAWLKCLGV